MYNSTAIAILLKYNHRSSMRKSKPVNKQTETKTGKRCNRLSIATKTTPQTTQDKQQGTQGIQGIQSIQDAQKMKSCRSSDAVI